MADFNALNLEPGEVVGGYTLISRLGAGAMGSVWRVRDGGGTEYAMKILRDSLADDAAAEQTDDARRERVTARERLRREAMSLKKVSHPGVCAIVDMELDDALAFIVTELIEGKNLRDDVAVNGRYVGDDLERLAAKLIDAVKAVHAAGIVHRDIKPTNVMVAATGPVLVDFGIAMGEGESHVTRTGLVMGTPGFIAPEIIDGAESDEATDWWSVASVLAFAATGQPVFGTKPMMAVLEREASGSANLAGLPAGTMAAFRSALSPDRTKRITPDELLRAITLDALNPLQPAVGDIAGETTGETQVVHPFDPSNPRSLWRDAGEENGEDGSETRVLTGMSGADEWDGPDRPDDGETGRTVTMVPPTRVMAEAAPATMPFAKPVTKSVANPLAGTVPDFLRQDAPDTPAAPPLPPTEYPTAAYPSLPADLYQPLPSVGFPGGTEPFPVSAAAPGPLPEPTEIRRGEYLRRGRNLLLALGLIPAVAALAWPPAAPMAQLLLFWVLLTVGYNVEATLERERRRGSKGWVDGAIRVATLPWHMVKALAFAVARTVLATLVFVALLAAAATLLHLPWMMVPSPGGMWPYHVPMLADGPLSPTGLACAVAAAASWWLTAFWPRATFVRLGAGAALPKANSIGAVAR